MPAVTVDDRSRRSVVPARSGAGSFGNLDRSSTVTAGMGTSRQSVSSLGPVLVHQVQYSYTEPRAHVICPAARTDGRCGRTYARALPHLGARATGRSVQVASPRLQHRTSPARGADGSRLPSSRDAVPWFTRPLWCSCRRRGKIPRTLIFPTPIREQTTKDDDHDSRANCAALGTCTG